MTASEATAAQRKPKRRWFQFSLRTLMLLTTASAVAAWQWTRYVDSYRAQRRAAAALEELGARVTVEPADGPAWLRMLVGEENFVRVSRVNLSTKVVSDSALEHLKALSNLESLGLLGTQVSDTGLEHLKGLTNLESLHLARTQVGDAGLEHLKGLENVRYLNLSYTQVSDAGLEHLERLTTLEELILDLAQVGDAGLEHLKGLENLRLLSLLGTQVSDAGLEHLEKLTSLQFLTLHYTVVSDAGVARIKEALPNLRVFWESPSATSANKPYGPFQNNGDKEE